MSATLDETLALKRARKATARLLTAALNFEGPGETEKELLRCALDYARAVCLPFTHEDQRAFDGDLIDHMRGE